MSDENDRDLAVKTLREICLDFDAPKQAKATAARTLLELSGDIGKLQSEKNIIKNKTLSELTKAELDAEIAKISRPAPLDTRSFKVRRTQAARAKPRRTASKSSRPKEKTSAKRLDF